MKATPCIKISTLKQRINFPGFIRKLLIAWILAVTVEYLILPLNLRNLAQLEGLAQMSGLRMGIIATATLVVLLALSQLNIHPMIERWALVAVFAILAPATLIFSFTLPYLVVYLLFLGILAVYACFGWDSSPEPVAEPKKANIGYLIATIVIAVAAFVLVSVWTVAKVYTFSTSTYDFGLFAQMFYNMKETGLPMTTLERDGWLSHFDVHVSPIYYLMLPFYMLVPIPATLQVLQAAVMASAAIPMWKIGKHHGLSGLQRTLLCALLMVYPAFCAGCSYDIHENCFLTPLLLWLFYGIDRKNIPITAIATVLTLMVKEDAAVYVAVIALWLILKGLLRLKTGGKWSLITGGAMLVGALIWFYATTSYLASSGDGVMNYRYKNFFFGDSTSLITVIKAVLLNPMKAVYECVDPEKLKYIGQTMLPLLGLPLLTRRYERLILLIPYILINLMSDYVYQHDIFFQYNYGSIAFLMYLTAVNLTDLKINWCRITALGLAVLLSATCFYQEVFPIATAYPQYMKYYKNYYQVVQDSLATIPDDASVAASGYYTTALSQREIIYDTFYCSTEHLLEVDYIVLQVNLQADYARFSINHRSGLQCLREFLERNGFELCHKVDGILLIYKKQ
jgi:uncharacterized membrane protein